MTVYVVRVAYAKKPVRVFWRRSEADAAAKELPDAEVLDCEIEGVPLVMGPHEP